MEFFLPQGEKRAFPRTRISLNCELQLKDGEAHLLGQCLDLSTTGARVVLSEKLACGSRAQFKLREHLGKEPFEAIVEVTRINVMGEESSETANPDSRSDTPGDREKDESMYYCAGLKIIEIL